MKSIHTLIIPDVHGRTFWQTPVKTTLDETDAKIVFLGDFHDPYPYEFSSQDILQESFNRAKEILELKKKHPDRVTLLLGNHDCGYAIGDGICSSRMDLRNRAELERFFGDNRESFQIAAEAYIAGKHFIFSHAGILKGWVDPVWGEEMVNDPKFNIVDHLNNAWLTSDYGILGTLGDYDKYRGWGGYKYGSPVWSDIRSWVRVTPEETFGYNIVGHTQLRESPAILDTIADLDCRKAFFLDENGVIRDYLSGEECGKTDIQI